MGPLEISLQDRHQLELFYTQPLVEDFMSRKFSCGLPGLGAENGGMRGADEVECYQEEYLSADAVADGKFIDLKGELLELLAGPHATFGSLTFQPGTQFIIAQLVTRPAFCYSVPAVRMGMYLFVYFAMLTLFAFHVLLDEGSVGLGETIFFVYVVVSKWTLIQMRPRGAWTEMDNAPLMLEASLGRALFRFKTITKHQQVMSCPFLPSWNSLDSWASCLCHVVDLVEYFSFSVKSFGVGTG